MADEVYIIVEDSPDEVNLIIEETPDEVTIVIDENVGARGLSAYQIAVVNGFSGNEQEWLNSLIGEQGQQGVQGVQGIQGERGIQGIQGERGLQGIQGDQGIKGVQGEQGIQGIQGVQGVQGIAGDKYQTTSSSPITIPVVGAIVTFVIGTNLSYSPNQTVIVSSILDVNDHFHGSVVSYNSGTGSITLTCTDTDFAGETYSSWAVNLAGAVGTQGEQGIQGIQGDAGVNGSQGIQGEQGIQGTQGIPGPQGPELSLFQVEVNFGSSTSEDFNTSVTVNDLNILSTSKILCSVAGIATDDHSIEEILASNITVIAGKIIANTSFDILAFCDNGTYGKYKINYTINY